MNKEIKELIYKRNAGLCFIVLSILLFVTGFLFIPLAIVDEYFVPNSFEAILVYISFSLAIFLLAFGIIRTFIISKKIKLIKNGN